MKHDKTDFESLYPCQIQQQNPSYVSIWKRTTEPLTIEKLCQTKGLP